MREAGPYLAMGTSLAVTVLLGLGIGYWLDGSSGTKPVFFLVGAGWGWSRRDTSSSRPSRARDELWSLRCAGDRRGHGFPSGRLDVSSAGTSRRRRSRGWWWGRVWRLLTRWPRTRSCCGAAALDEHVHGRGARRDGRTHGADAGGGGGGRDGPGPSQGPAGDLAARVLRALPRLQISVLQKQRPGAVGSAR